MFIIEKIKSGSEHRLNRTHDKKTIPPNLSIVKRSQIEV